MGIVRLALALAVMCTHLGAFPGYAGMTGGQAVQCFFMISGFYMAMIINERYGVGAAQYRAFLGSRALRIYPLYLLVLGLSLLASLAIGRRSDAGGLLLLADDADTGIMNPLTKGLFAAASLLLVGISWLSFHTAVDAGTGGLRLLPYAYGEPHPGNVFFIMPQAWTLDLEVTFYCLAPLILRRRGLVAAMLAASLGADVLLRAGVLGEHAMRNTLPVQLWLFCLGALAYGAYARLKDSAQLGRLQQTAFWASLGLVGLFGLLPGPVGEFLGLLAFAACLPLVFLYSRHDRRDRTLGELSYPIYLSHFLVIAALQAWAGPLSAGLKAAALVLTLALSWALYVAVARPLDRLRHSLPACQAAGNPTGPQG